MKSKSTTRKNVLSLLVSAVLCAGMWSGGSLSAQTVSATGDCYPDISVLPLPVWNVDGLLYVGDFSSGELAR